MVVMDQFTRRIIGFAAHAGNVAGIDLCCMFNKIITNKALPKYLSSDNDPLFQYYRWTANLRILAMEEIKSVPYVPTSHPFVERCIGTVRRELLDRILFWNAHDLQNKLESFQHYYNEERSHCGIDGANTATKNRCNIKYNHIPRSLSMEKALPWLISVTYSSINNNEIKQEE